MESNTLLALWLTVRMSTTATFAFVVEQAGRKIRRQAAPLCELAAPTPVLAEFAPNTADFDQFLPENQKSGQPASLLDADWLTEGRGAYNTNGKRFYLIRGILPWDFHQQ